MMKRTSFLVLVLEGLVGIIELFNFSFFSITVQGIDLDYWDIECFALERSRDLSVIVEISSKYYISDSFVDYDQIRSDQWLSRVQLCNPMNRSMPGLPVHHQLLEFTQSHVHRVGDAIQPISSVVPFSSCPLISYY